MDFNQIYRAPSLPKLSKRNISSSVLRGASAVSARSTTPRLRSSRFSFLKPAGANVDNLKQTSIADTLAETNKILIEIQNQLATDFALRIAEEKEGIKKIRAADSKKRFLTKEGAIEKIKGIGSGLKNQVDKILAPTKSIFQKIIDFFKVILTGIVLNTAFKWLEKKENQEKLGKFFGFLADHWKWIVATLGTIVLVDIIAKLVIAAQSILTAFSLLGSPVGLTILGAIAAAGAQEYINKKEKESLNIAAEKEAKRRGIKKEQVIQEYERTKNNPFLKFIQGVAEAQQAGGAGPLYTERSKGGEIFKSLAQKFSTGGTVGGKGTGAVDTVPAMLAPGEFVIRTAATRLFKPFLSDINENAGRLFDQFKQAIIGLTNLVAVQKENSEAFNKILEDFNKFLDSQIKRKKDGVGGGNINIRTGASQKLGSDVPSQNPTSALNISNISLNNNITPGSSIIGNAGVIKPKPTPRQEKAYSTISTKPSPRTNIIPINLPPIKSKPPEISTPTRTATEVPNISSVNIANPYMQLTPELYGIFV